MDKMIKADNVFESPWHTINVSATSVGIQETGSSFLLDGKDYILDSKKQTGVSVFFK